MRVLSRNDFKYLLHCDTCKEETDFKVHQYFFIKSYKKQYKNSAIGKCSKCGHSSALIVYGQPKTIKSKGKEKLIIDPKTAKVKKMHKEPFFFKGLLKKIRLKKK